MFRASSVLGSRRLVEGVGSVKIPYYVVVKGRGYWRPTKAMREKGFAIVRCGGDGPDAWRIASIWNSRWQAFRRGETPVPISTTTDRLSPDQIEETIVYPRGSIGEAFRRYRRTKVWAAKAPRTREDWWRGWKRIKPFFGDLRPSDLSLEDLDQWRGLIQEQAGQREAHRATKIWRALWKVMAALQLCERDADPSLGVPNTAAKGRSATWTEGEVVRLVKAAWRNGYFGLAALLAVMWDSQMSPGDVRTLQAGQIASGRQGRAFVTDRAKTGVTVGAVLSARATAVLGAYLDGLGYTPLPDQPIFRNRGLPATSAKGGRPRPGTPYTSDVLGRDFRALRESVFGAREARQLLDFRRSGAVEAIAGGAGAENLSRAMGNTLASSNALFETYVPVDQAMLKGVADARRKGRAKMRDKNE